MADQQLITLSLKIYYHLEAFILEDIGNYSSSKKISFDWQARKTEVSIQVLSFFIPFSEDRILMVADCPKQANTRFYRLALPYSAAAETWR